MEQKFFTLQDDFHAIIKLNLPNVTEVHKIPTGWTNYVFRAKTKSGRNYIFRFPRNDFFANCIILEGPINRFIRNKVGVKTANLKLLTDKGRTFSMHPMIKGKVLQDAFPKLNQDQKKQLATDIAKYISSIQKIKPPGYTCPTASVFLAGLEEVNGKGYGEKALERLRQMEVQTMTPVHGDLNPGNIIVDDSGQIVAVLDYAFLTCSCKLHDLARICGRLPSDFRETMVAAFEKEFNTKVNTDDMDYLIDLWTVIENDYKDYMFRCHPDIVMPSY